MNIARVFKDASFIHQLSLNCSYNDQCALSQVNTVAWDVLRLCVGRRVSGIEHVLRALYETSLPPLENAGVPVHLLSSVPTNIFNSFRNNEAPYILELKYYSHSCHWYQYTTDPWNNSLFSSPLLPNLETLNFTRSSHRIHNLDTGELDNDPSIAGAIRALAGRRLRCLLIDGPINGSRAFLSLTQALDVLDAIHPRARLTDLELLAHRTICDSMDGRTPDGAIAAIRSKFATSRSLAHITNLCLCSTSISYDLLLTIGRLSALTSFTIKFPHCSSRSFRDFVPCELDDQIRREYFCSLKSIHLEDVPGHLLIRLLQCGIPVFNAASADFVMRTSFSYDQYDPIFSLLAKKASDTLEDFTFTFPRVMLDGVSSCYQMSTESLKSLAALPLKRLRLNNVQFKGYTSLAPLRGLFGGLVELHCRQQRASMEDIITIARERKSLRVLAVTLPLLSPSLELPIWHGERSSTSLRCEANFRFQGVTHEWVRRFSRWLLAMFPHFEPVATANLNLPTTNDAPSRETVDDLRSMAALQYMIIFISHTTDVVVSDDSLAFACSVNR